MFELFRLEELSRRYQGVVFVKKKKINEISMSFSMSISLRHRKEQNEGGYVHKGYSKYLCSISKYVGTWS